MKEGKKKTGNVRKLKMGKSIKVKKKLTRRKRKKIKKGKSKQGI